MEPAINGSKNYFSGGLAEIVSEPSSLTYSFLKDWFNGTSSFGIAMHLLSLPYKKTGSPILEIKNGQLLVNLEIEEETIYKNTIFTYRKQKSAENTPSLKISYIKLLNPACIFNTLKILLLQSKWIASPKISTETAASFVEKIPSEIKTTNSDEINEILRDKVWPYIIAIGILAEFYDHLIQNDAKKDLSQIQLYITSQIAKNDWFFQGLTDQMKVKNKQLEFDEYIKHYGLRADDDYELTSPRWREIKSVIKERIDNSKSTLKQKDFEKPADISKKLQSYVEAEINLQIARSNAKKKALIVIDKLRQSLIRKKLIKIHPAAKIKKIKHNSATSISPVSNHGFPVSQGTASGIAKLVSSPLDTIPENTIGIFPNASPQFSTLYQKCEGMIFLRGGQTSHGAIVAREFGIPAIVDSQAENIKDGTKITIDGKTGNWKINK